MKKTKEMEDALIANLEKVPIVQVSCEKVGITRQTFYRWCKEDTELKKQVKKAKDQGIAYINDIGESQLIQLMKEKNFSAVRYWLSHRHKDYMPHKKLEMLMTNIHKSEKNKRTKKPFGDDIVFNLARELGLLHPGDPYHKPTEEELEATMVIYQKKFDLIENAFKDWQEKQKLEEDDIEF